MNQTEIDQINADKGESTPIPENKDREYSTQEQRDNIREQVAKTRQDFGLLPPPPDKDNWQGRSEGMLCQMCRFFVEKKRTIPPIQAGLPVKKFGRCRCHAPTLQGWPAMFGTDWCGDHKLDENKI